jgi:hypothetical protein
VQQFRIEESLEPGVNVLVAQADPFSDAPSHSSPSLDIRVMPLTNLCRSLFDDSTLAFEWYEAVVRLWERVEATTSCEPRSP